MKMKKFIALLTVAGMTATMAVGCGSSSNGTSDNAAGTNTESSVIGEIERWFLDILSVFSVV